MCLSAEPNDTSSALRVADRTCSSASLIRSGSLVIDHRREGAPAPLLGAGLFDDVHQQPPDGHPVAYVLYEAVRRRWQPGIDPTPTIEDGQSLPRRPPANP